MKQFAKHSRYTAETRRASIAITTATPIFSKIEDVLRTMAEEKPIHCLYPHILLRQAKFFLDHFPGKTLYAVKANPDRDVLKFLYAYGIRHFEVASRAEIDFVLSTVGSAQIHFMHPVKSRSAIRHAYSRGVRVFAFDSRDELSKILEETAVASDLTLILRLSVANDEAALNLSAKFGATEEEAIKLLKEARMSTSKLGLCFHVGSQCTAPGAFRRALHQVSQVIEKAGVPIEVLDVGGGFPSPYPGYNSPPLGRFFAAIQKAIVDYNLAGLEVWCEPGRAMVSEAGSVLAKVELRKDDKLYLNDGTYGALFDAGQLGWRYPTRLVRLSGNTDGALKPFKFYGPTCDCLDTMPGPFLLPADIREGDWIEIQNLGGYGLCMRTNFNGFGTDLSAIVEGPRGQVKKFKIQEVKV